MIVFRWAKAPLPIAQQTDPRLRRPKTRGRTRRSSLQLQLKRRPLSSRWFAANLVHLEGTHSRPGGSQHWIDKCSNRAHLQTPTTCLERCRLRGLGFLDDVRPRSFPLSPHERILFPSSLSQWSWPILCSYFAWDKHRCWNKAKRGQSKSFFE